MKKGIFLVADPNFMNQESGIGQKIKKQVEVFNENGLTCKLKLQKKGNENMPSLLGKLCYYLPFTNIGPKWELFDEIDSIDFLYFRHPAAISISMKKFLKEAKSRNNQLKIYMEIPTFPYEGEYIGLKNKIVLLKDKINRHGIADLIDCIFVIDPMNCSNGFFGDANIVRFINGYDVKNTRKRKYKKHDSINLTCVGMFNKWHGYERLIEGLYNYYKNGGLENIQIDMVGEGSELSHYKELVKHYNLGEKVIFHGKLYGDNLDNIYETTDIGVASLGRYKSGISVLGDLKTREYFAKGIPVLSGCKVDIIEEGFKTDFYYEVTNNASPINFDEVLKFYKSVEHKRETRCVEEELHQFALQYLDINKTLSPIVEVIKKSED